MRMLPLVLVLLLPAITHAEAIPWQKLPDAARLSASQRKSAAEVMARANCYHGCVGTVAECLRKTPRAAVAWRLANYVAFLVGKGLRPAEVHEVLELRRLSALPPKTFRIPTVGAPRLGPEKARVVVVEYADFQCAHCAALSPVLKQVIAGEKEAALYFKVYPMGAGEPVIAARAALAAHRQGKFWPMQDRLFAAAEGHSQATVERIATELGLDLTRFRGDMLDAGKAIDLHKIEGLRFGIKGTPALFINGKPYRLRRDAHHLRERIREELELLDPPAR
ncbi:MAG: thioredoxin domain-containing protein [Deltaproteobacteria bacterium]|nr:thioredoxin domain-containing protein [Deltaproteobacteria bacterium]